MVSVVLECPRCKKTVEIEDFFEYSDSIEDDTSYDGEGNCPECETLIYFEVFCNVST